MSVGAVLLKSARYRVPGALGGFLGLSGAESALRLNRRRSKPTGALAIPVLIDPVLRAADRRLCNALQAEAFADTPEVAAQPVIQVQIGVLAHAQLAFEHFQLCFNRRRAPAQADLIFRKRLFAAEIRDMQGDQVALAPSPGRAAVATTKRDRRSSQRS